MISSPRVASATPRRRFALAALTLVAVGTLTACAAEPTPTSAVTEATSAPTPAPAPAESTPTGAPTPTAVFALPGTCDEMLGDTLEARVAGSDLEVVNASGPAVTEDTWDGSEEIVLLGELGGVACGYHFTENGGGVDGTGQVYTAAAVSDEERSTLTALLDQGDYEKTEEDGRTVYTHVGYFGETVDATIVHELSDGVWLSGRWNAGDVAQVREILGAAAENVGAW
ncbi:hypothetical protein ELQ92_08755 [Labedella populi]|uniref:DUF3558 domain-containing protein n=1 Tax=Labedella populi TaxID=2498850 RepID=A0A444QAV0_9MICO|nr:hypothetical protein [Labedella populi]RWZ61121.1 hypothetical protein ELQ92_08755 [Labedella populi]